jgi:hypothetical protein
MRKFAQLPDRPPACCYQFINEYGRIIADPASPSRCILPPQADSIRCWPGGSFPKALRPALPRHRSRPKPAVGGQVPVGSYRFRPVPPIGRMRRGCKGPVHGGSAPAGRYLRHHRNRAGERRRKLLSIERPQQRHQLVSVHHKAVRIAREKFAQGFIRRVAGDVAAIDRPLRLFCAKPWNDQGEHPRADGGRT